MLSLSLSLRSGAERASKLPHSPANGTGKICGCSWRETTVTDQNTSINLQASGAHPTSQPKTEKTVFTPSLLRSGPRPRGGEAKTKRYARVVRDKMKHSGV